jgi:hypothetical protein
MSIEPVGSAGHDLTLFVDLLGSIILGGLALGCVAAALARIRRAGRVDPLVPGLRTIIGEVVADAPPVTLEIEQQGSRTRSGHAWSEVRRTERAVPFDLRHEQGELVRVESDRIALVEAPKIEPVHYGRRLRRGVVAPGDRVHVFGELVQEDGWRIRARLVSHDPIVLPHRRAAARLATAAATYLFGLALLAFAFREFDVLELSGRVVNATVTARQHQVEHRTRKRYDVHHYVLQAATDGGELLTDEVARPDYDAHDVGSRVPFLRGGGYTQIGERANGSTLVDLVSLLAVLLFSWAPVTIARSGGRDARKLIEHGRGPLPDDPG